MPFRFVLSGWATRPEDLVRECLEQLESWQLKPGDRVHFAVRERQVGPMSGVCEFLSTWFGGAGLKFTWEVL